MAVTFALPPFKVLAKGLNRLNQHLNRAETQKRIIMDQLGNTSVGLRKARNRQFIQLGALIQKAGLLETFEIPLGADLQKDPETKLPVAALFKGLLEFNKMAHSGDVHLPLWGQQGLEELGKEK